MDNNISPQPVDTPITPSTEPKKNKSGIIALIIIFSILTLALPASIIAFVVINLQTEPEFDKKLVCTSNKGTLSVYYNGNNLTGTKTTGTGFDYELRDIENIVSKYSSAYEGLAAFGNDIVKESSNTTSCTLNDTDVTTLSSTKTIGNKSLGYIDIPKTWGIKKREADRIVASYEDKNAEYFISMYMLTIQRSADDVWSTNEQDPESYANVYASVLNRGYSNDRIRYDKNKVSIGKTQDIDTYQIISYLDNEMEYVIYASKQKTHITSYISG